jgi:HPt (histidine-containing phosphotransfer) domain-containing protein
MTAHAMAGEKEKCLQLGMNDYVSKPIKETVLYNMIGRHAQNLSEESETMEPVLNLEYLSELSGGDKTFEQQILKQFTVQMPEEIEVLETAIENKNFDIVRQTAHSLKSTVGYIGLSDELHPFLDRLEKDAIRMEDTNFQADMEYVREKCFFAKGEVENILNREAV